MMDDLISRQAAIDAINSGIVTDDDGVEISVYAIERMKNEQIIRHRRSCRKLSTG